MAQRVISLRQGGSSLQEIADEVEATRLAVFRWRCGEMRRSALCALDIENVFLKTSGPYLRHSLAHGLLPDGTPYGADAIYGCWLIFHLCMLPLFPIRTQLMLPFDDAAQDQAAAP